MKKIAIILLVIIGVIFAMIMTSCNTYKKQLAKFNDFSVAHPDALAVNCARFFPVKDSVGKTVVDSTHRANNVNYQSKIDSLSDVAEKLKSSLASSINAGCPQVAQYYLPQVINLTAELNKLKAAYKPCKPDIIYSTTPIYQVDEAKLAVANNKYNAAADSVRLLKSQLADQKTKTAGWRKWTFILGGIIALSILGTVLKILGKI